MLHSFSNHKAVPSSLLTRLNGDPIFQYSKNGDIAELRGHLKISKEISLATLLESFRIASIYKHYGVMKILAQYFYDDMIMGVLPSYQRDYDVLVCFYRDSNCSKSTQAALKPFIKDINPFFEENIAICNESNEFGVSDDSNSGPSTSDCFSFW